MCADTGIDAGVVVRRNTVSVYRDQDVALLLFWLRRPCYSAAKHRLFRYSMTAPTLPFDAQTLTLETDTARAAGQALNQTYRAAEPYHHICVDDFLTPGIYRRIAGHLHKIGL